jgi:DNA replication protein DnaC
VQVLLLDDFLLTPATAEESKDLLEIIEDRTQLRSTMVVSQLPWDSWHQALADPTLADAILDRLIFNAYRIALNGASMRRRRPQDDAPAQDHGDPA